MSGRPGAGVAFFLPRIAFAIVDIVFLALVHVLFARAAQDSKEFPPDGLVLPALTLVIVNVLASWLGQATYESREYISSYGMYGNGIVGNGIQDRKSNSRRRALLSYIFDIVVDSLLFAILVATSSWFAAHRYTGTPWWINFACCIAMAAILIVDLRSLWKVYRSHTKMRKIVENQLASNEDIDLYCDEEDDPPTRVEEGQRVVSEEM